MKTASPEQAVKQAIADIEEVVNTAFHRLGVDPQEANERGDMSAIRLGEATTAPALIEIRYQETPIVRYTDPYVDGNKLQYKIQLLVDEEGNIEDPR